MKRAAAILLAGTILVSCGAVVAAGDQSLVSKSYVDGTFTTQALEQVGKRAEEQMSAAYNEALNSLNSKHSTYLAQAESGTGGTSASAGLRDLRFKKGDVLTLSSGSGVMLLAGSVSVAGGTLIDTTAGVTVPSGSLTVRHRCLVGETTAAVTVTSDTAVLCVEGGYTLSASGNMDYNAMADGLAEMGLLKGTGTAYGSGYDLERQAIRVEGLVMFIRLLGEEKAALASTAVNPFADSPSWADRYLAYAYEKGYTTGVGTNAAGKLMFGPNNTITAGEYMTFVLRALGYSESGTSPDFTWQNAMDAAVTHGVIRQSERTMLSGTSFCRAQVVYLSVCALSAPTKTGGILLNQTAASGGYNQTAMQTVLSRVSALRLS